jgi:MoxR-like ATPase
VTFFATANLGMEYTGAEPLDRALADRIPVVLAIDFPPKEQEIALLTRRCPGLSRGAAQQLVEVATQATRADG